MSNSANSNWRQSNRDISKWTTGEVEKWNLSIPDIGIEIACLMKKEAIDGSVLLTLTEDEVTKLIPAVGTRKKWKVAFRELIIASVNLDSHSAERHAQSTGSVSISTAESNTSTTSTLIESAPTTMAIEVRSNNVISAGSLNQNLALKKYSPPKRRKNVKKYGKKLKEAQSGKAHLEAGYHAAKQGAIVSLAYSICENAYQVSTGEKTLQLSLAADIAKDVAVGALASGAMGVLTYAAPIAATFVTNTTAKCVINVVGKHSGFLIMGIFTAYNLWEIFGKYRNNQISSKVAQEMTLGCLGGLAGGSVGAFGCSVIGTAVAGPIGGLIGLGVGGFIGSEIGSNICRSFVSYKHTLDEALVIFGVSIPIDIEAVNVKYKQLEKVYGPNAQNGGNKDMWMKVNMLLEVIRAEINN